MENQTVYDFVTTEEANFRASPIEIVEGLEFSFYETVRLATLYKNSQLSTGKDDDKPVQNIVLPLVRLQYRTEGFDVKDIQLYVDDPDKYYLSFLARKFHQKWALENDMDTFIDNVVESYVDYGASLLKDVDDVKPDVERLPAIAFCDQTDMLSGPICFKRSYSPDQLREEGQKRGWNMDAIDTVITLAGFYKTDQRGVKQNKTPGKYIEVRELHGVLPAWWLEKGENDDEDSESDAEENAENELVRQLQIVTFYKDKNGDDQGITLFAGKQPESPFDSLLRDAIFGRALGLGGIEELFEAQVWTTYDNIRIKGMLDAASKVIYATTDPAIAAKHPSGLKDMENGEVIEHDQNTTFSQVNTTPVSIALFENSVQKWNAHAQELAGASPFLLGASPGGKTAFRSIAALIQQANAIHEYRQGKIAVFFEKLYRKRFLPIIAKEIANGATFLSELSLDELQEVAKSVVACQLADWKKEKVLNGETWSDLEAQQKEQDIKAAFMQGGNKRFIEILKDELKDLPLDVHISIASKQQDFADKIQKLTQVITMIIQTQGQILKDPVMAKLFNEILEYSGLDPLDFSSLADSYAQPQNTQPQPNPPAPTPTPAAMMTPPANMPVPSMVKQVK